MLKVTFGNIEMLLKDFTFMFTPLTNRKPNLEKALNTELFNNKPRHQQTWIWWFSTTGIRLASK